MEANRSEQLNEIMRRLAAGDDAATWTLCAEFGGVIGATMRRHLASMGMYVVADDDLQDLVAGACAIVRDVAGSWSPEGGASPWHYARGRLRTLAKEHIGQHAELLDDLKAAIHDARIVLGRPEPRAGTEPPVDVVMAGLVMSCEPAALLDHALRVVNASERDRVLLFDHAWQEAEGDRSPATTLAPAYGMSCDSVRQAVSRLKRKLRVLVEADEEFAPLADLPLIA